MRYQSLEINYHTAPNNKSTALPILQKIISIMVCLLGRAEYLTPFNFKSLPCPRAPKLQQATDLDATTSRVECLAQFISHCYGEVFMEHVI